MVPEKQIATETLMWLVLVAAGYRWSWKERGQL